MKAHIQLQILFIFLLFEIFEKIFCRECPDIIILNPYKSRSWIVEGIQIYNSSIRLLRGANQPGTSQQVSNLMVWDSSTNHCLKIFDLDLQINKMLYCKVKRKLFIAGTHKILEIHPLTFEILDQHNIGGTQISDLEDSDSLILIGRDQGNPFLYDIYQKQVTQTLPYQYQNIYGENWAAMLILKDFSLFIASKLIIFDRNDNYKLITYLGGQHHSRACAFKKQNFLITSINQDQIQLGFIYKDLSGVVQYKQHAEFKEVQVRSQTFQIRAEELYCVEQNNDFYVIFAISDPQFTNIVYKGVTVLKINSSINPTTLEIDYKFSLQEKWKYRRWRENMEFFLFDESTFRGQSISEYEHYSFEFLESNIAQCDFDEDGQDDSYCRMAKTITHWPWNLNMGVYFLGQNSEYFIYGQDNQEGYQIRDWNSTEILRFNYTRKIEKDQFAIRRVIQSDTSTYKLPYDTYIMKMCWLLKKYPELKSSHNQNAGFYIYQHYNFDQNVTDTYNLIDYMNPSTNQEKYKNPFFVNSAFTYGDELHVCVSYTVLEINKNKNEDIIDVNKSFEYFSNHNKECYKLKNELVVNFYQLKQNTTLIYGQGNPQYTKCSPYFLMGQLICRNPNQMLEFWSLKDYTLTKNVEITGCIGDYDIAIHRQRLFLGCDNSIVIYDTNTQKIKTFLLYDNKIPLFVITVQDILAIAFSTMEIYVYDIRPADGAERLVLHYNDTQDCCLINSIDIHPVTKKLIWVSITQINYIDLTPCLEDPQNCKTCDITGYFSYDPQFSFIKQKYERASWQTAQPKLYVNPKFLDSGKGTIDNPYLTDMNIIQLYYKTHYYKQNIVNFQSISLNIYIDVNKNQYMGNNLVDWTHDKTKVKFFQWDGTTNPKDVTERKIKIVINSAKYFQLQFKNWGCLEIVNIQIACPNCVSNALSFKNIGEIYLRNFIVSLNITDLIEPENGQTDKRVFPNIKINVQNVKKFQLQNQQIQNSQSIDLNQVPFFSFTNSSEVKMEDIIFSNIVNQESLFESVDSHLILKNIKFTNINTCLPTQTQRKKFSIIPFQNLVAYNITFIDNQFCEVCLFQNLISSSSTLVAQLIQISNVKVINNKFGKYNNSSILFLKMSLLSLISSTQSIEVSDVRFEKNYGSGIFNSSYYFELIKISYVLLKTIIIIDENLVGIGSFNRLNKLEIQDLNYFNTQYLSYNNENKKRVSFSQNLILIQEIDKLIFYNFSLLGLETKGIIPIQIEENLNIDMKNITISDCSLIDSLLISISNLNKVITTISIVDSVFKDNIITTMQSYIQVGFFWIRAEKSSTEVSLTNNTFFNNTISVNPNTLKKSSLSFSIDNQISKVQIENCTFYNYYSKSAVGDLFLNVYDLKIIKTKFKQNLSRFISTITIPPSNDNYIKAILIQMERTNSKGTFLSIQAQGINLSECQFSNAISAEGLIQIFSNNNYLLINLDKCKFSNLYASTTGTAIYVSTLTSPANINITNCQFYNLWLGNIQKQDKAHLYFESSPANTNKISITNLDTFNIGILSQYNSLSSNFIFQTGFNLTLSSTVLKQRLRTRNLIEEKMKTIYQNKKQEIQESNKNNYIQKRLLQIDKLPLSQIMKDQNFFGSTLVHSVLGTITFQNLEIEGDYLFNNQYSSLQEYILQSNILWAESSQVQIYNLTIQNMIANKNGGLILITQQSNCIFDTVSIQNIDNTMIFGDAIIEINKDIGQSNAFINCLKSNCTFNYIQTICQKIDKNQCKGRILNLQEGLFIVKNSHFDNYFLQNSNGTAIFVYNPQIELNILSSNFTNLITNRCGGGIYLYQDNLYQYPRPMLTVQKNIFLRNRADQYGGAISFESLFVQNKENFNIMQNQFLENTAHISGAFYYSQYHFDQNLLKLNKFESNFADMANDIFSFPSEMHLKFETNSTDTQNARYHDQIINIFHGSGLLIPRFNIDLIYHDSQGKEQVVDVSFLQQQREILQIQMSFDMKTPINQSDQTVQQNYFLTGNLFSSYDELDRQLYFSNIELYGRVGSQIYLMITSPYIKEKQIIDKRGNISTEPYRFIISVTFRECTSFEIIIMHQLPSLSPSIKKCQTCPDLSYSRNKEVCEQCPIGAVCKSGQEMIIQQGYWRASYETYSVLPCISGFEGCIGGQSVHDNLCQQGYIGPLCQECDLFNKRGEGKFSHLGKTLCRKCVFDFLGILMIIGNIYISVYLTIRAIQSNSSFIKAKVRNNLIF